LAIENLQFVASPRSRGLLPLRTSWATLRFTGVMVRGLRDQAHSPQPMTLRSSPAIGPFVDRQDEPSADEL